MNNIFGKQQLHFATSFGFNNVYPPLTQELHQLHGQQYLGLKGLLEWLELHLGCYQEDVNDSIRTAIYKKAVAKALKEDDELYYSDSFDKDAWGTAKQLLYWRDELVLTMHDIQCDDSTLSRLFALSRIEAAISYLPLGVNDRWILIYKKLQDHLTTIPLETIHLYEQRTLLHPFFEQLFTVLEQKEVTIKERTQNSKSPEDSDLGHFQHGLTTQSSTTSISKNAAQGDGSLIVLRAENDLIIAKALTQYLSPNPDTVLILEDRGEILERALTYNGHPAMGFVRDASEGSLDQLFKAITVFLWSPINPERMLQYLTLPEAPLPRDLRLKLAEAMASVVGINNEKWNDKLTKYYANNKKTEKQNKSIKSTYSKWFDRPKNNHSSGTTKQQITSLYSDLKDWANYRIKPLLIEDNHDKHELISALAGLASKCDTLLEVIELEYEDTAKITEIHFNNILEEIEVGQIAKSGQAELGSFFQVNAPANITQSCDQVIWWNFVETSNPFSYKVKFDNKEKTHLAKTVTLYNLEDELELWYTQLKNPFLKTGKQIILCLPSKVNGEEAKPNPLLNDIIAQFENHDNLIVNIELNDNSEIIIGDKTIATNNVDKVNLPGPIASEWHIEQTNLKRRELESFSSLNLLFNHPSEYFLSYVLNIKSKEIPQTSISNLLKGNVSHRIAEELFNKDDILEFTTDQLKTEIEATTMDIIESEGLTFLLDKNAVALSQFKKTVIEAYLSLTQMIKSNGWKIHKLEEKATNPNSKIPLTGYIDIQLIKGEELAIIDLKWGGLKTKREMLAKEKEVQLNIYDRIKRAEHGTIHLAYFIISANLMLSRNKYAFVEAQAIESTATEVEIRDALWQKMVNTYAERWAELDKGIIEVGDELYTSQLDSLLYKESNKDDYLVPFIKSKKKEPNKFSNYKSLKGNI